MVLARIHADARFLVTMSNPERSVRNRNPRVPARRSLLMESAVRATPENSAPRNATPLSVLKNSPPPNRDPGATWAIRKNLERPAAATAERMRRRRSHGECDATRSSRAATGRNVILAAGYEQCGLENLPIASIGLATVPL